MAFGVRLRILSYREPERSEGRAIGVGVSRKNCSGNQLPLEARLKRFDAPKEQLEEARNTVMNAKETGTRQTRAEIEQRVESRKVLG